MKRIFTLFTIILLTVWLGMNSLTAQTVLYGVTNQGGTSEQGVLFEFNPSTGTYTKKHDFDGYNGGWPSSSLSFFEGKFFGMTNSGGSGGNGVIYEWDPVTQSYTVRYTFDNTNGAWPFGDLTFHEGKFYGTSSWGGAYGNGTIFEWDPVSYTFINKYDFLSENGYAAFPMSSLVLYNGKFYGMTNSGGPDYRGYIYEWDPVTNVFTRKYDFDEVNGFNPIGGLTLYQDKFYSTTSAGGVNGAGVIFEYDPVSDVYTKKIDLDCSTGCYAYMSFLLYQDKFIGVTYWGGSLEGGVIFEWDPATNVYIEKHSFDATTDWMDGAGPQCLLTLSGGKFYGTTTQGGTGWDQLKGVIFEWDPVTGIYTKKFDFDGINGAFSAQTAMVEYTLPGTDEDGDGYSPSAGDCNDGDPAINPGAAELCNSIDDDCDGEIDEDFVYSSISGATITSSLGTSFCVGPSTVFTIEGGLLGTGAEWFWYEGWCGNGDPIGIGETITVTPSAGAHSYHVRGEGTCNITDCASVSITANFAPSFYFCQTDIIAGTDPGLCSATLDYTDVAVIGSPAPLVTYEFTGATTGSGEGTGRGNTFNVGTTFVTVTAINECGSDVCTFTITVEDDEGPAISDCPSDIVIGAEEGQWGASASWTPPTASDNCTGATLAANYDPGHFFNVGSTVVTYIAADEGGNEASCQFNVTVTPPDLLGTVNLSVISSEISFSDNNPEPGSSLNVKAIIRNNSNIDAGSFSVQFKDLYSNTIYPPITVPGLNAWQSVQVIELITAPVAPAFVPVMISVDIADALDESSELDNVAIRPYICGDLALPGNVGVLAGAVPASVPAGSILQICGSASYDTDPPLSDPSVAGAEVVIAIVETGEQFHGYTDEDGSFCISYRSPNTPGEYHFTVEISDNTLEGDASGSFILTEPVTPCPMDLTVRIELSVLPPSFGGNRLPVGTIFSGTILVINDCAAISEPTSLYIAPPASSGTPYVVAVPALGPGEEFPVTLSSMTLNTLGTFYLSATVDYENILAELSEENNTAYEVFVVLPPKPDIVVSNPELLSDRACTTGNQVKFQVSNSGLAPTGEFTAELSFYLNDIMQTSQSMVISDLDPGEYSFVLFSFAIETPEDVAGFGLVADPANSVDELSEFNNELFMETLFQPCLPDLVVMGCGFADVKPADPVPGTSVSITATLLNEGDSEVDGPFDVEFNLGGAPLIHTVNESLAPQQTMTLALDFLLPLEDCPSLTVIADPGNNITEHFEDNNAFIASLCYDFEITNSNCPNGYIFLGEQYFCHPGSFNIGVLSEGLLEASNLGVAFEISGPGLTGWVNLGTESIYMGNTCGCPLLVELSSTFSFPQSGAYLVRITLDPENLYGESDESNNQIILSLNVVESADYEVLSSYIFPSDLTPEINEAVSFSVSYTNNGCIGFSSIELHASMDNEPLDSLSVPNLPAGGWNTVAIPTAWSSAVPGVHVFRAIIDHDEIIAEGNEMNNEATKAIIVGGAPDYHVLNVIASDDSPAMGQVITLSTDIQNEGQSTGSGLLRFLWSDAYGSEEVISEVPVSILPGATQNYTALWLATDPNARIIAHVVNVSPLEFDLSDNQEEMQLNDIAITLTGTDVSCNGGDDGGIMVNITGGVPPYSFAWSDPSLFGGNVNVPAGDYEVMVTDLNGLTAYGSVQISEPPAIIFTETHIDASCDNLSDGSINLSVSGGVPPYDYEWDNGEILQDIFNLAAGIYSVLVTDGNSCSASLSVTINASANATAWYQDADNDGFGNADAVLMSCDQPTGYVNAPGDCDDSNSSVSPAAVEVCDNNTDDNCNGLVDEGCNTSCDISVNAGADVTTYFGIVSQQTVTRTAVVSGGTAPYTFSWSLGRPLLCNQGNNSGDEAFYGGTCLDNTCPASGSPVNPATCSGAATITATLLDTALVCVTVTDANGCAATDCFYVNASDIRCIAGNSGNHKVKVCHSTGNPNNPWVEICVDTNSLDAHLAHGDYIGSCEGTRSAEIVMEEEEETGFDFTLFPNPAGHRVTLSFHSHSESSYRVEIMDFTGRVLVAEQGAAFHGDVTRELDLVQLSRGIYLVTLTLDGNRMVKKLIRE